jgi:hypothetical protein
VDGWRARRTDGNPVENFRDFTGEVMLGRWQAGSF